MRLYIRVSKNSKLIPFNYQHLLTGVVNKWIGKGNDQHGKKSLYSFSWLQKTHATKEGINIDHDAYFFFSALDSDLIKKVTKGILSDPEMFCGISVADVQIKDTPELSSEERLFLNSPILLRLRDGERTKHVTFQDDEFNMALTKNIKGKMKAVGLCSDGFSIELDKSYPHPQTKLVDYKGVKNKTTLAPVIAKGKPEQIGFARTVGLGSSTGIGFGSVK